MLDLDHVGPEAGEELGGERQGRHLFRREHPDPGQRPRSVGGLLVGEVAESHVVVSHHHSVSGGRRRRLACAAVDVGDERWASVGSVHRVPVARSGGLHLCGLEVIGPDPVAVLDHLSATTVVCLQTDEEIERRHPRYLDWLADPAPAEAWRLPTADHLVADDEEVLELVGRVLDRLDRGDNVLAHCGAGWGRAGVLAVLVMVGAGSGVDEALVDLRPVTARSGFRSPTSRSRR